jgi:hypothetical protein
MAATNLAPVCQLMAATRLAPVFQLMVALAPPLMVATNLAQAQVRPPSHLRHPAPHLPPPPLLRPHLSQSTATTALPAQCPPPRCLHMEGMEAQAPSHPSPLLLLALHPSLRLPSLPDMLTHRPHQARLRRSTTIISLRLRFRQSRPLLRTELTSIPSRLQPLPTTTAMVARLRSQLPPPHPSTATPLRRLVDMARPPSMVRRTRVTPSVAA